MGMKNLEKWESSREIAMAHQGTFFLSLSSNCSSSSSSFSFNGSISI